MLEKNLIVKEKWEFKCNVIGWWRWLVVFSCICKLLVYFRVSESVLCASFVAVFSWEQWSGQVREGGELWIAELLPARPWPPCHQTQWSDVARLCSCNGSIKLYSANFSIYGEQVLKSRRNSKGHGEIENIQRSQSDLTMQNYIEI